MVFEYWPIKTHHRTDKNFDDWVTECPVCKQKAYSELKLGPYICANRYCGQEFMGLVESWTEDAT